MIITLESRVCVVTCDEKRSFDRKLRLPSVAFGWQSGGWVRPLEKNILAVSDL